jgi:hypothetical protein
MMKQRATIAIPVNEARSRSETHVNLNDGTQPRGEHWNQRFLYVRRFRLCHDIIGCACNVAFWRQNGLPLRHARQRLCEENQIERSPSM